MFASFNSNTMNAISAARTAPRPEYMNSHLGLFCGLRVVQSLVLFVMPVSNHESDRSCTCVSVLKKLMIEQHATHKINPGVNSYTPDGEQFVLHL
jgi:hypothetical protein